MVAQGSHYKHNPDWTIKQLRQDTLQLVSNFDKTISYPQAGNICAG